MTNGFTTQIELDAQGVAWIAVANVSPEEIHFQHPHLSLAQIHAALTYYYENQPRFDAQIKHRLEEADRLAGLVSE